MLDKYVLPRLKPGLQGLAAGCKASGLSANQVTILGFLIGCGAVVAVVLQSYWLALALLFANRIADGIDGELARLTQPSDAGGYLDIILDFLFYNGFVVAFILLDPVTNAVPGALLMLSFMGTGGSFLAFASLAAKWGLENPDYPHKSLHYMNGLTEGTETIVVFALMCLFPAYFPWLAYIFAGLCGVTTVARIWGGYRALALAEMKSKAPSKTQTAGKKKAG